MSSKVMVIYKMVAHPGRGDDLAAAFDDDAIAAIAEERGTEMYVVSRSAEDPDVLWCTELFANQAAFDEHRTNDTAKRLGPTLAEIVAARDVLIGTPLRGCGVSV
jgi:quinol monooxygenase YgiN